MPDVRPHRRVAPGTRDETRISPMAKCIRWPSYWQDSGLQVEDSLWQLECRSGMGISATPLLGTPHSIFSTRRQFTFGIFDGLLDRPGPNDPVRMDGDGYVCREVLFGRVRSGPKGDPKTQPMLSRKRASLLCNRVNLRRPGNVSDGISGGGGSVSSMTFRI